MPWDYDRLPLDVINWLMPVQSTIHHLEYEAQQEANRKASAASGYHR